ncbi:MAG: hypothetical protein OXG72_18490 [Acidobacteria bacterium]|nr:hypothetical protein [Acidobacteriota bacterium]
MTCEPLDVVEVPFAKNRLLYLKDQPVGACESWAMPCRALESFCRQPA